MFKNCLEKSAPSLHISRSLRNTMMSCHIYTGPPLRSRGNIVTSHAAGPGSIPGRVSFVIEFFFRGFPSTARQMSGNSSPVFISSSECLPKGRSFTANSGTKAAVLLKGWSSTENSRSYGHHISSKPHKSSVYGRRRFLIAVVHGRL